VTKEIRADGSQWLVSYESTSSRVKQVTDPKGQVRTYDYFLDGRLKQMSYTGALYPTPNVSFTYDAAYPRLSTMTDGTGTTTFSYNPVAVPPSLGAGRLSSVDGPGAADTVTYTYDELGRRTTRTIDTLTTTWGFDALGRLTTVGHTAGTFTYAYVGATRRRSSLSYPNGTTTTYSYLPNTNDRRLGEIHHKFPGGATLAKFNYTYDAVGNITTWQQQNESEAAKVYDFSYDLADQLISATYKTTDPTPVVLKRYVYSLDPVGNRIGDQTDDSVFTGTFNNMNRLLSVAPGGMLRFAGSTNEAANVTVAGTPAVTSSANTFSGSAAVGSGTTNVAVVATDPMGNTRTNTYQVTQGGATKTYSYDANGNLTQKVDGNTWVYEWYANDRLARVTKDAIEVARFTYDGFGRRYRKVASGVTTTFAYDAEDIIREQTTTGTTYHYVHGPGIDEPLARRDQTGTAIHYHSDHLGSIVKTTGGSGQVITTRRYDPSGNPELGAAEPGYAYTGREWDAETGLYYYRARYYDPAIGRFISQDPARLRGGPNRYLYADNNPANLSDPFGLWSFASEYNTTGDFLIVPEMTTNIESSVDDVFNEIAQRDAIVTFTTNGTHDDPDSLHYTGEAIDLRTRDLTDRQRRRAVERLREELGDDYDVVDEGDHIHVEYDPDEPC
jgi:RHS repeat-associated protein